VDTVSHRDEPTYVYADTVFVVSSVSEARIRSEGHGFERVPLVGPIELPTHPSDTTLPAQSSKTGKWVQNPSIESDHIVNAEDYVPRRPGHDSFGSGWATEGINPSWGNSPNKLFEAEELSANSYIPDRPLGENVTHHELQVRMNSGCGC
jgi:hypothetical protein